MPYFRSWRAVFLCLTASLSLVAADDKLANLTKAVTAFKLPNGAQFFVVERPYSPLVAFHMRVKAGIADEPSGRGGLATLALVNFLQGSESYGTRNQAAEKTALAEAEKLLDTSSAELAKGDQGDDLKRGKLEFQARSAYDQASNFGIRPRYFEGILVQNGATNVELHPTADFSDLALTIPSNRAELWFRMVSSWLQAPSMRFFMQSRELVVDQRERAAKTSPLQRERTFGAVFSLNPYQATAAGDGELNFAGPGDVTTFIKAHYVPSNMTVAIVGDIAPSEARRLAELYFGKLPANTPPEAKTAESPKAETAQPVRLAFPEAPIFAAAWPRPAGADKSDAIFEMVQAILAGGVGSRLNNELMVESKVASRLAINSRFPGGRYPGLFLIEAEPLATRSHDEVEVGITKVLAALGKDGVTREELERARHWWREQFLVEARTAAGRAQQLARLQTEYGTYKVEELLARLDAVTADECKQLVTEYFAGKPYFSIVQLTAVSGSGQ